MSKRYDKLLELFESFDNETLQKIYNNVNFNYQAYEMVDIDKELSGYGAYEIIEMVQNSNNCDTSDNYFIVKDEWGSSIYTFNDFDDVMDFDEYCNNAIDNNDDFGNDDIRAILDEDMENFIEIKYVLERYDDYNFCFSSLYRHNEELRNKIFESIKDTLTINVDTNIYEICLNRFLQNTSKYIDIENMAMWWDEDDDELVDFNIYNVKKELVYKK